MKKNIKIVFMGILISGITFSSAIAQTSSITVGRAFYELAKRHKTKQIENLIYRGYSIESPDENGNNPICLSILNQDKEAYKVLISYKAKQNPSCVKNIPPMTYKRFYGYLPQNNIIPYTSDTPYWIGGGLVAIGAGAALLTMNGGGGGSGSGSGGAPSGGETPPTGGPGSGGKKCPEGQDYYGDIICHKTIEHCASQQKGICNRCENNFTLDNNQCVRTKCPAGEDFYGDTTCHQTISGCIDQSKDSCNVCAEDHNREAVGRAYKCFIKIENCKTQVQNECKKCEDDYSLTNGRCYKKIEHCRDQFENKCEQCISGYGTHEDANRNVCYKDIEYCIDHYLDTCRVCDSNHEVYYTDPTKCWEKDHCAAYPNTVPDADGDCVCNEKRGYVGEAGSCTRVEEGEYQEGQGEQNFWSNDNEKYCSSHGIWDKTLAEPKCRCYEGYKSDSVDCSECADDYLMFDNVCYRRETCGLHQVQQYNKCVCESGYQKLDSGICVELVNCPTHMEQTRPGTTVDEACTCKAGFDDSDGGCEPCKEGYTYDGVSDMCIKDKVECSEPWQGENCNICPIEYKITYNAEGEAVCGEVCADNRLPKAQNPDCSLCNEALGYEYSPSDRNCIKNACSGENPEEGYIKVVHGDGNWSCDCDKENGYSRNNIGVCVKKEKDRVGLENLNINNSEIVIENDGKLNDIYGIRAIDKSDIENPKYYANVYNALARDETKEGSIEIINKNTGYINIYGIYSESRDENASIYNAATINNDTPDITANGTINITDENSFATIYGIKAIGTSDLYNSFVYSKTDNSSQSTSNATIEITKSGGYGDVVGMVGENNLYNAYAITSDGTSASVTAKASIKALSNGESATGTVIGMQSTNMGGLMINSYAYLDSFVSNAIAEGSIEVEGMESVYGMLGRGSIINSQTQFNKSFPIIQDFKSKGTITVTTAGISGASQNNAGYGIYVPNNSGEVTIYNAMGYNTEGIITVNNFGGGNAYGIYSETSVYDSGEIDDEGNPLLPYNSTYNAFRSSSKFGGDNVPAYGLININISGYTERHSEVVGIKAGGDVYNAYANSGSEVKLESIGKIDIKDSSATSDMTIKGIDAGGGVIANAFGKGEGSGINKNTATNVEGKINIELSKGRERNVTVAGIYSNVNSHDETVIYNAALIDNKNTVKGEIILSSGVGKATPANMYGIYAIGAASSPITIYNAYYKNDSEISDGHVEGKINVIGKGVPNSELNYYGIYVEEGDVYNVNSTNNTADVSGRISVVGYGTSGQMAGIYAKSTTGRKSIVENVGNSEIYVSSANGAYAYGIMGENTLITNDAKITVESPRGNAYGIYLNQGTVTNELGGEIIVSGGRNNYGIYAISNETGDESIVKNYGTINVSGGTENIGIYGSGPKTTVENYGEIIINGNGSQIKQESYSSTAKNEINCSGGNCNNGSAIVLENGAEFINAGTYASKYDINFENIGGKVSLSSGGHFVTEESIEGTLFVDKGLIRNNFANVVYLEDAITSKNVSNLNVISDSYLYRTFLKNNQNGSYDVELKKKDFAEVTLSHIAPYLTLNYENRKNLELFKVLKSAKNEREYKENESNVLGTKVLPNIVEENLKVVRSLDRKIISELFKNGPDIKKMVGADAMYVGRGNDNTLTGYDITAESTYAVYDKKLNNNYRLGVGLSFTNVDTDYNNDSSRKNFMVQGYVPFSYTTPYGIKAVAMARLGYGNGHYTRYGYNNKAYKSDTSEFNYGLLNELRYTINMGKLNLTPFVGLNAIGYYQHSFDEGNEVLAIHTASDNIFSLESALGVYLDKLVQFNENNRLKMALGIGYYHEFADPYKGIDATINQTLGAYKLRADNRISKDRGILSAKINYDYKDFSIYGELLQYLEKEHPIKVDVGLEYRF